MAERRRGICGSNHKPGERVSILDFCLLCWGTGWRNTPERAMPTPPIDIDRADER